MQVKYKGYEKLAFFHQYLALFRKLSGNFTLSGEWSPYVQLRMKALKMVKERMSGNKQD